MKKILLVILCMSTILVGCKKGPTKAEDLAAMVTEFFQEELNEDARVEVLKAETAQGGQWVLFRSVVPDGNGNDVGQLFAIDLTNYEVGMTYLDLVALFEAGMMTQILVEPSINIDGSPTGYFINSTEFSFGGNDFDAGTVVFEQSEIAQKDLEKIGGVLEQRKINQLSKTFVERFGLSEARGMEIAKVTYAFNQIQNQRAVTEADANEFTLEVLGVEMSKMNKAIQESLEGNDSGLDSLIKKAADQNEISPEHMREIINLMN